MNFDFLYETFGSVLAALYELRHSYAFMIIGLTLMVMVVVTPLTLKATRSMLMMQQLQPEMKKLQSQYKDDRQKLNEELLKFYRENNINPVGGCLPLLVQTPIFLLLYNVLRGLTLRVPVTGNAAGHVTGQELVDQPLTAPPEIVNNFAPLYLPSDSQLYENLSSTNEMTSIGLDLARSASDMFTTDVVASLPYLVLIALVAVTGVVQQRQIQSRSSGAMINPQQQMIMKVMPLFLPIFSFALPAGLVLYFVVSNTYRVGQQWFISRNIYAKHEAAKAEAADDDDDEPDEPVTSGGPAGFLDRLLGRENPPVGREVEPATASKGSGTKAAASKGAKASTSKQKVGLSKEPAGTARPAKKPSGGGRAGSKGGGRTTPSTRTGGSAGGSGRKDAAPTARNGRDPEGTAGKKAGSRRNNAPGRPGQASSTGKRTGAGSDSSGDRPPTLQPRARKNKKR